MTPIHCHLDLPPGTYRVTVELGGGPEPAVTAVWAEHRRLVLGPVRTGSAQRSRHSTEFWCRGMTFWHVDTPDGARMSLADLRRTMLAR